MAPWLDDGRRAETKGAEPWRLCDAAAEALHASDETLSWNAFAPLAERDADLEAIREALRRRD